MNSLGGGGRGKGRHLQGHVCWALERGVWVFTDGHSGEAFGAEETEQTGVEEDRELNGAGGGGGGWQGPNFEC